MSRSVAIVAVGAVCLGALGAAITLPALVLGGHDAPPAPLPIAGSGTHTVVQAAALPAPRFVPAPREAEPSRVPTFSPAQARSTAHVTSAAPTRRATAAGAQPPVGGPHERRAVPEPPQRLTPQPAETQAPLLALSTEETRHAKPKRHKHLRHARPKPRGQAKKELAAPAQDSRKRHPKHEKKQQHELDRPRPRAAANDRPGEQPKGKKHEQAPPVADASHGNHGAGEPPKEHEDKPPKSPGDKAPDGKGPKR